MYQLYGKTLQYSFVIKKRVRNQTNSIRTAKLKEKIENND